MFTPLQQQVRSDLNLNCSYKLGKLPGLRTWVNFGSQVLHKAKASLFSLFHCTVSIKFFDFADWSLPASCPPFFILDLCIHCFSNGLQSSLELFFVILKCLTDVYGQFQDNPGKVKENFFCPDVKLIEMILNFRAHRAALMTVSYNSGLEFFRMSKEGEEEE